MLRQSLLLFYVYMFGDISENINHAAARASMKGSPVAKGTSFNELDRGKVKAGESFGMGDSRAAFNLKGFMEKRRLMGVSEELMTFLETFVHSQMFERFCADRVQIHHARHSLRSGGAAGQMMNSVMESHTKTDYDRVCRELEMQHLSATVYNIRHVMDQINRRRTKEEASGQGGEQFHPLALQVTSNSSVGASSDGGEISARTKADMEHICADAAKDGTQMGLVCRTIWLRLSDCRLFNWKHGLRGLQLLHVLLLHGPHGVLSEALDHLSLISSLREYGYDNMYCVRLT